jgi:CubicO group peptidase (beta-lactamase class C family)
MCRAIVRLAAIVAMAIAILLAWQWPFTVNLIRSLRAPAASAADPDATSSHLAIELVSGRQLPLPGADRLTDTTAFDAALAYAEDMQSYSLLVWHRGQLLLEKYMNGGSAQTRAESASMHKSVMAMVVGHALADGLLGDLDDPVDKYLKEWAEDERGRITLRQLLQMSSGLSTLSREGGLLSEASRFSLGLFPERLLLTRQLQRPPGTAFEYLNVNSNLMGLVLSRVLDKRYSEYLSEKIWQPLGAADAYVVAHRPGGFITTASSLLATPRDWLRLGIMLANDGVMDGRRVLPEGWLARMITPSPLNPNYGLQIWLSHPYAPQRYYYGAGVGPAVPASEPFLAEDMFFFDGWGGQRVYVSPAEQLVIVRTGRARTDWDDSRLPNLVLTVLRASHEGP